MFFFVSKKSIRIQINLKIQKTLSLKYRTVWFFLSEYPTPNLPDLTPVKNLRIQQHLKENPSNLSLSYADITQLDTISVELVPEKKGIFLKHSEYVVSSRKFGAKVTRRYNDFVALYELLLNRFPYR